MRMIASTLGRTCNVGVNVLCNFVSERYQECTLDGINASTKWPELEIMRKVPLFGLFIILCKYNSLYVIVH